MIKYNLICNYKHEFESWFLDSKEYEKLNNKRMLECIYCNSRNIKKTIMSPRIVSSNSKQSQVMDHEKNFLKAKKDLLKLRKIVEKNFKFVGNDFAKKVREMYYDEKSQKNIYGTTSQSERDELREEGIDLVSIPWVEKNN